MFLNYRDLQSVSLLFFRECVCLSSVVLGGLFFHACALEARAVAPAGGDVAAAWKEVQRLEAGPPPAGHGDPKEVYGRHVVAQEAALRRFLEVASEESGLLFEARFRLARVLALRAELEANSDLQAESDALLDALEKVGTHAQQSHIAFTKISQ